MLPSEKIKFCAAQVWKCSLYLMSEKWLCSLQESLVKQSWKEMENSLLSRHFFFCTWTSALFSFCEWSQLAGSRQRGFLNRAEIFSSPQGDTKHPTHTRHLQPSALGMTWTATPAQSCSSPLSKRKGSAGEVTGAQVTMRLSRRKSRALFKM